MPVEAVLERISAPDDPLRCKGVGEHGQCPYRRVEGTEFCPRHGGTKNSSIVEQQNIRNYRLAKWKARLDEFADNPQLKSLRDEIGMLRILMEEIWNRCNDSSDLMMNSNRISDLAMKLEKLVTSCHRLEQSSGQLLDKTAALNFAMQIVTIIGSHVNDVNILDLITEDIMKCLSTLTTAPKGEANG